MPLMGRTKVNSAAFLRVCAQWRRTAETCAFHNCTYTSAFPLSLLSLFMLCTQHSNLFCSSYTTTYMQLATTVTLRAPHKLHKTKKLINFIKSKFVFLFFCSTFKFHVGFIFMVLLHNSGFVFTQDVKQSQSAPSIDTV